MEHLITISSDDYGDIRDTKRWVPLELRGGDLPRNYEMEIAEGGKYYVMIFGHARICRQKQFSSVVDGS